jgi:hypothetical protein
MIPNDQQIEIINYAKAYLKKMEKNNVITALSSLCYFPTWSETPGNGKIKLWLNGKFHLFKFLFIILKNIISIAAHSKYSIHNDLDSDLKYNKLVLSWSLKENFQSDGSFNDKYFNENSNDLPNSKWILISVDGYFPKNLNKNIIIIKQDKSFFKYNLFFLTKKFISLTVDYKFAFKKIIHYFSFHSYFAEKISTILLTIIKKNNFETVILPYEAQPFHQFSISQIKKNFKEIFIVGYMHSMLPPVPSDFIYRSGAPDLLLVHGESQSQFLKSKLDWPENKIYLIKSLRFRIENKNNLSNKIYLPYNLAKKSLLLDRFESFLISALPNSLPIFDIKNHSTMLDSSKHIKFKESLKKIMEIYKNRFSTKPINENFSIFFGVTASIFEALETGTKVIHICSEPLFQHFDDKIWPNLKTEKHDNGIYSYSLFSLGKYINFGTKNDTLQNALKNINLKNRCLTKN